ncbi:SDR family NAD(P)-dependent oxidoreductase [Kibdelosporangium phytohabitans]|uniref:Short-chain dehydrogenase n=1 Tax=Kibdelosporangium phytohabitans TaxID=860235 RepID=A0A0N9I5L5_9PSEU|nr:SDR family oxidoreductase [Kibdelosporangium phytohabitans]ALG10960.1 short-chain dehydrogenase [Kibdelosporangium phytohabitans]MBE1462164.1 NAD(P)-dependent dehydrogenase (short-subunit alcohol dehydrogenase family) [Kibdelosporangium phytohabitans]
MDHLVSGMIVLVAGADGGIGGGITRRFAESGADVIAHTTGAEVDGLKTLTGDLTDEQACHELVREAAAWKGRLDAVVNSAGIQPVQTLDGMTAAQWREVVDTNLTLAFNWTQAAVNVMRGNGGSITHIASIEGSRPAAGHGHYNAAKAALIMHARSAALEYGGLGIRVNTVSPGLVERPGISEQWPEGVGRWRKSAPLGRLGTREDVGDACVFLASPLASWITGHDLVVDGGMSATQGW